MRHRIAGKQLNRDTQHRTAMFRNLAAGLFEHGEIRTTLAKAKAVQPFIERCITVAKRGDFHARRELEQRLNDRMIHVWVADPAVSESKKDNDYFDLPDAEDIEFNRYGEVRKAPRLVQHILSNVAPRYADRDGGYTRIVKLGSNRLGDGADHVLLQLVGEEDGPEIGGAGSNRRRKASKRAEFAARLRKAGKSTAASGETVEDVADQQAAEPADTTGKEAVREDIVSEADATAQDAQEQAGDDETKKD